MAPESAAGWGSAVDCWVGRPVGKSGAGLAVRLGSTVRLGSSRVGVRSSGTGELVAVSNGLSGVQVTVAGSGLALGAIVGEAGGAAPQAARSMASRRVRSRDLDMILKNLPQVRPTGGCSYNPYISPNFLLR
jgi:hypothetical protein